MANVDQPLKHGDVNRALLRQVPQTKVVECNEWVVLKHPTGDLSVTEMDVGNMKALTCPGQRSYLVSRALQIRQ